MLIDCCPISTPSATLTHKSLQDSVSQSLSKYKTLKSDRPNFQAYRTHTDTAELSPKVDFKTFSHSQGVAHTEAQNQAMAMSLRCPKDNTAAPFLQGDAIRMDCFLRGTLQRWHANPYTALVTEGCKDAGWISVSDQKFWHVPKKRSAGQTPPALQS